MNFTKSKFLSDDYFQILLKKYSLTPDRIALSFLSSSSNLIKIAFRKLIKTYFEQKLLSFILFKKRGLFRGILIILLFFSYLFQ